MNKTLLLAQLIKNGELGGSSGNDTVVLNYQNLSNILDSWSQDLTIPVELHAFDQSEVEDELYTKLAELLNHSYETEADYLWLTNHKIVCWGKQNRFGNLVLSNFYFNTDKGSNKIYMSCDVHYRHSDYGMNGIIEGTLYFHFVETEQDDYIELILNVDLGVCNLEFVSQPM